jgi:glycosyltransferase involved in cell wall biosynthesis
VKFYNDSGQDRTGQDRTGQDRTGQIKILSIHVGLGTGGAEALMARNVLNNLDHSKFTMDFVTHAPKDLIELWEQNIIDSGSQIFRMEKIKNGNIFAYKKQWQTFFKNHSDYDIAHIHFFNMAPFIAPIAEKYGIKVIVHSHTTENNQQGLKTKIKKIVTRRVRDFGDYRFACGIDAGNYLFGNEKAFSVINNGIQLSDYIFDEKKRIVKRAELGISEDIAVIGTIGRISYPKNPEFILELIQKLKEQQIQFKFLWVGTGMDNLLKAQIKSLEIEDYIIHLENRTDIAELLNVLDVFIFPSRFEGLSLAAIEMQANGLPAIFSDKIPNETIRVSEKVTVLPIDQGVSIWVDEIKRLLNDKNIENRQTVMTDKLKEYDIKKSVKKLEAEYLKLATQIEGE